MAFNYKTWAQSWSNSWGNSWGVVGVVDGGDLARGMDELHRQRILEDDKIILELMHKFMENLVKCH